MPTEVQSADVIDALRAQLDEANMQLAMMTARAVQAERQAPSDGSDTL